MPHVTCFDDNGGLLKLKNMEKNSDSSELHELFSSEEIKKRVQEISLSISNDYVNRELHIVGILKGAFIFVADLVRFLTIPCYIHFLRASSYGSKKISSGQVKIQHTLNLANKHILLVEDIVDTGLTLNSVINELQVQHPASLKICSLLDKPVARKTSIEVDYIGFTIPNKFVVGYGIDFSEHYRELPYIAELKD